MPGARAGETVLEQPRTIARALRGEAVTSKFGDRDPHRSRGNDESARSLVEIARWKFR